MQFEKSFYETEIRCDFEIPEMMKRAWAAELEVYEVLHKICLKHDIKLFADWGTLLGAVRHKGFIPWDDDMDFCILREDYNHLIEILPYELPAGFVMTGMYANDKRLQDAADVHQLRIMADETYWDFNSYMRRFHGFPYFRIGLDIFPLDYYQDNDDEIIRQDILIKMINILTQSPDSFSKWKEYSNSIEQFFDISISDIDRNTLWKMYDSLCMMFTSDSCYKIMKNDSASLTKPYIFIDKKCFDSVIYLDFEHIQIPVPIDYKQVLEAEFGNYTVFVKQGAGHNYPFYKKQEQELSKIMKEKNMKYTITEMCRLFD